MLKSLSKVEIKNQLGFGRIAKGAFYLYISTLITSVLGYVFWFIVSKLTSPNIVGLASTAVTIATIAHAFTMLGIPTGIQRFLGKAYAKNDTNILKSYFTTGFTILTLTSGFFACMLIFLSGWLANFTGLPVTLLIVAGLLTFTSSIYPIFYALFISTLQTKLIMYVNLSASISRLTVGILLILAGLGALGIMLGYLTLSIISLTAYLILTLKFIGPPKPNFNLKRGVELFKAGSVNWLPAIISILGLQLGVLVVYGFHGAFQAGLYFIAYAIAGIVLAIPSSLFGVMFPVLSGMEDGREKASWKATKLTLTIVVPIALALTVYSKNILSFFGPNYIDAWLPLTILLIAVAPFAMVQGVNILAYASGLYSLVLILGVSISLPRTLLYIVLTPLFGGVGAAEAFLAGTITGLVCMVYIGKKIGAILDGHSLALIFLPPSIIGATLYLVDVWWIVGVPLILAFSLFIYTRLKIMDKKDVEEVARSFLSEKMFKVGVEKFSWIIRILYGE